MYFVAFCPMYFVELFLVLTADSAENLNKN